MKRYNWTLATQLRHYVREEPERWDELLAVLTMAYNSQPHRSTGIFPFELILPRRIPELAVRIIPPSTPVQTGEERPDGSALCAKRKFMARLRKLIPVVAEALRKTQSRYKRNYDATVAPRSRNLAVADYAYVAANIRNNKLEGTTLGPFLVVDRDEKTVVLRVDSEDERLLFDQVTPAPAPDTGETGTPDPENHALLRPGANQSEKPTTEDESLINTFSGLRKVDAQVQLKVRWYGYGREKNTWEQIELLPRNLVLRYLRTMNQQVPGY